MIRACVRKFDVTGTVQIFLETKQAHRVGLDGPKLRAIFLAFIFLLKIQILTKI